MQRQSVSNLHLPHFILNNLDYCSDHFVNVFKYSYNKLNWDVVIIGDWNSSNFAITIERHFSIFDYFLIDGLLKCCSEEEISKVLIAFIEVPRVQSNFFGNFIFKHIPRCAEIFKNVEIIVYSDVNNYSCRCSNSNNFQFDFLNFIKLSTVIEGCGDYIQHLNIRIYNGKYSDKNNDDLMEFIDKNCKNLKYFVISIHNSSVKWLTIKTRESFVKKYHFMNNVINFEVNNLFDSPQPYDIPDLEELLLNRNKMHNLVLTSERIVENLTPLHVVEILKEPFYSITFSSNYNKIQNWKFLRQSEYKISLNPKVREINVLGDPNKSQMCLGNMLMELYHLNNKFALQKLTISFYTFEEFKVPDYVTLQTFELKLENCQFGDNSMTNNALRTIKHVFHLNFNNTAMPMRMFRLFQDLNMISFTNCDYLNDDRIIQIYDLCTQITVNYRILFFSVYFILFYILQTWSIESCPITDQFFYHILSTKINAGAHRQCVANLNLPVLILKNLHLCSDRVLQICNFGVMTRFEKAKWDVVVIGDQFSSGSMIVLEENLNWIHGLIGHE